MTGFVLGSREHKKNCQWDGLATTKYMIKFHQNGLLTLVINVN
ncbi:hypothetical protein PSYCG_12360 [Psychrobacter sp. G]|nr:hypothetical protein PSYCG_12360 [Psychrobacter sp. G]